VQLGIHGEQRLEYQQLYLQYRAIYERALEQFCLRENIAFGTFVDACEAALTHSEWAEYSGFAECVLAMSTYCTDDVHGGGGTRLCGAQQQQSSVRGGELSWWRSG